MITVQSDEEYEAILYLLNEDIFCWEYMRPEVRDFIENMTEEEKDFIRSKRAWQILSPVLYYNYQEERRYANG